MAWFISYLSDHSQIFRVDGCDSVLFPVNFKAPVQHLWCFINMNIIIIINCSVPQGSCLGPVEFVSYTEDVVDLIQRHRADFCLFADDRQLYISATVTEVQTTLRRLSDFITGVTRWCSFRPLQLIVSKTELMWIGTRQRFQQLFGTDLMLMVGGDVIKAAYVACDLAVFNDDELPMKEHISC